jgi:hypothetical protein
MTNEKISQHSQGKVNNTLDKKTLDRINRLSCQQIMDLSPRFIKVLTCDFDERYARLVVSKGSTSEEQNNMLDVIKNCFYESYKERDVFGYETLPRDYPSYFEEWECAFAFDELITPEPDMPQPSQIVIQQAESIPQLLEEEGQLRRWMDESANRFLSEINDVIKRAHFNAQIITNQFSEMRNGSINRLLGRIKDMEDKLRDSEEQKQKLIEENSRLNSWYVDWQRLRQLTALNYNPSDIAEIGDIDDPTVMTDAIEAIMSKYTLQKENEELRAKQEAWRESEEYKAERTKWERANKQRIDVQEFKKKLLRHAATYTASESEKIRSLVLNLNEILRATAWENVSATILEEALSVIRKNEMPQVAGDFVLNKHVANEVNGVESGATGISVNKEK